VADQPDAVRLEIIRAVTSHRTSQGGWLTGVRPLAQPPRFNRDVGARGLTPLLPINSPPPGVAARSPGLGSPLPPQRC
jgi:hypothetical protein